MPNILGKVTTDVAEPRGPDVLHRIGVPERWLEDGYTIELELPRNLTCAACEGGGCDACDRSGAVTLRGRTEPPELVEVTLPRRGDDAPPSSRRGVTIRVPSYGGLAAEGSELPRGNLLLRVVPAAEADAGVRNARPTEPPPSPPDEAEKPLPKARPPVVWILVVLVILWILFLIFVRVAGIG